MTGNGNVYRSDPAYVTWPAFLGILFAVIGLSFFGTWQLVLPSVTEIKDRLNRDQNMLYEDRRQLDAQQRDMRTELSRLRDMVHDMQLLITRMERREQGRYPGENFARPE